MRQGSFRTGNTAHYFASNITDKKDFAQGSFKLHSLVRKRLSLRCCVV